MVVGGADYGNPEPLGLAVDLKMTEKAVLSQVRVFDSMRMHILSLGMVA
jgi:hypothetical protein